MGVLVPHYDVSHPNPEGPGGIDPHAHVYLMGASVFGGPHDPGTGKTGYRGQNLEAGNGFYIAELGMGTLLGGLPRGTRLYVTNPKTGAEVLVTKEDIGLGGAPVQGHLTRIDLWYKVAIALGLPGAQDGTFKGLVYVRRADGKALPPGAGGSMVHNGQIPTTLQQGVAAAGDTASQVGGAVAGAADALVQVPAFLGKISSGDFLLRAGKIGVGGVLIILGAIELGKVGFGVDPVKAAGKLIP